MASIGGSDPTKETEDPVEPIVYTGACNVLSMQRFAAIKMCEQRMADIASRGEVMELSPLDQQELVDLSTRVKGLRALLAEGCVG